jgi:hypothetical protein
MYRPTLAIDAIGLDDLDAIPLAMENMSDVLMALVSINRRYIRRYPDQIPLLYEAGVVYDRMEPAPGTACGDDDWADIIIILEQQERRADCEDLACWRVAELNERFRVPAVPFIRLYADRVPDVLSGQLSPRHLYHILVRWPDGRSDYPNTVYRCPETGAMLEDPSRVLGME